MKSIKEEYRNLHLAVAYESDNNGDYHYNLYSFESNKTTDENFELAQEDIQFNFKAGDEEESKSAIIVEALTKRYPHAKSYQFIPF